LYLVLLGVFELLYLSPELLFEGGDFVDFVDGVDGGLTIVSQSRNWEVLASGGDGSLRIVPESCHREVFLLCKESDESV
jgi:hypothetical protein